MHRRHFNSLIASSSLAALTRGLGSQASLNSNLDRCRGLLLGGLIGDAIGGPMEFAESPPSQLCNARSWPEDRRIDSAILAELAKTLPFLGYEKLRPAPAPYGQWKNRAPAGTLTDDSRHKMILMMAIKKAQEESKPLSTTHLASAYLAFQPIGIESNQALRKLDSEGFQEYRLASRWVLGDRDLKRALPPSRLWSGVETCAGQMLLPPLAVKYAGKPKAAYRKSFEVDFVDAPGAKDYTAALIAGLAGVLAPEMNHVSIAKRWKKLFDSMITTDPFRFSKVPYVGRPFSKWLDLSDQLVKRCEGNAAKLFSLLLKEGKPVYYWDAHFTILVPVTMIKFCEFNSLAAMHLVLDFGFDTDSYAQILGCMVGAVHGEKIFPLEMRMAVRSSLKTDYGHDVEDWVKLLRE